MRYYCCSFSRCLGSVGKRNHFSLLTVAVDEGSTLVLVRIALRSYYSPQVVRFWLSLQDYHPWNTDEKLCNVAARFYLAARRIGSPPLQLQQMMCDCIGCLNVVAAAWCNALTSVTSQLFNSITVTSIPAVIPVTSVPDLRALFEEAYKWSVFVYLACLQAYWLNSQYIPGSKKLW